MVQARLRAWLEAAGIACEMFAHDRFGGCMAARLPGSGNGGGGGGGNRPIVLLGHCDTVFPDGTAARRPFRIDGDRAFGPGVADMKAGLVMNSFVLAALRRFGAPCPLVGLYTADEEIASPSSRPVIEAEAKDARAVFNAEPGRPSGNLVSRRKGAAFIELEVTGRAAHSGAAHADGVSAIEAMARKIQRLHKLTDYDLGTTVNVGLIQGGQSVNTVAPRATAGIDVRFPTLNIMEKILGEVREILNYREMPGSESRILREGEFPTARAGRGEPRIARRLRPLGRRPRHAGGRRRSHRRLGRQRLYRRPRHPHPVRHRPDRRQRPHRRRMVPPRHNRAARPSPRADHPGGRCRLRRTERVTNAGSH